MPEVEAVAAPIACERCGTFAELRSDGFKKWCETCWSSSTQLIDHPLTTTRALVDAVLQLLRQHFAFAFLVLFAFRTVPSVACTLLRVDSAMVSIAISLIGGSIAELLILFVVLDRCVRRQDTIVWPTIWARVRRRILRGTATNAVTGLLATLGTMLCFVPGLIASAVLSPALPIALYEDKSVAQSIQLSVERTRAVWAQLVLVLLVPTAVSFIPAIVMFAVSFEGMMKGQKPDLTTYTIALELFQPLVTAPMMLLQVVYWAATRPR